MSSTAGRSARAQHGAARRARRRLVAVWAALAGASASASVLLGAKSWHSGRHGLGWAVVAGGLLAAALCATAAWSSARGDPDRWGRGAAGEERTAEILSGMPRRRWVVHHDLALPGSRANVDHLAIGPTGVWLVDSKTTRADVWLGWRSVRVGSHDIDPAPTAWEAQIVSDRLGVPVKALIALHAGQSRNQLPRRGKRIGSGVRVVAVEDLPRRLRRGRSRLGADQVDELDRRVEARLPPRVVPGEGAGGCG